MNARTLVSRVLVLFLVISALVLPACNTMSGAGRDISSVGHSMENSAERNR